MELIERKTKRKRSFERETNLKSYPSFADMNFWRLGITRQGLSEIRSWKTGGNLKSGVNFMSYKSSVYIDIRSFSFNE